SQRRDRRRACHGDGRQNDLPGHAFPSDHFLSSHGSPRRSRRPPPALYVSVPRVEMREECQRRHSASGPSASALNQSLKKEECRERAPAAGADERTTTLSATSRTCED